MQVMQVLMEAQVAQLAAQGWQRLLASEYW
jgi:hypothetical protein